MVGVGVGVQGLGNGGGVGGGREGLLLRLSADGLPLLGGGVVVKVGGEFRGVGVPGQIWWGLRVGARLTVRDAMCHVLCSVREDSKSLHLAGLTHGLLQAVADHPASIVLDRPVLYAADEGVLLDYAFSRVAELQFQSRTRLARSQKSLSDFSATKLNEHGARRAQRRNSLFVGSRHGNAVIRKHSNVSKSGTE